MFPLPPNDTLSPFFFRKQALCAPFVNRGSEPSASLCVKMKREKTARKTKNDTLTLTSVFAVRQIARDRHSLARPRPQQSHALACAHARLLRLHDEESAVPRAAGFLQLKQKQPQTKRCPPWPTRTPSWGCPPPRTRPPYEVSWCFCLQWGDGVSSTKTVVLTPYPHSTSTSRLPQARSRPPPRQGRHRRCCCLCEGGHRARHSGGPCAAGGPRRGAADRRRRGHLLRVPGQHHRRPVLPVRRGRRLLVPVRQAGS